MIRLNSHLVLHVVIMSILSCILNFLNPLLVFALIDAIQNNQDSTQILVLGLFAVGSIKGIVDSQLYFTGSKIGLVVRAALIDQVYTKSLQIASFTPPSRGSSEEDSSNVVTLMSIDVERIKTFSTQFQQPFLQIPLSILMAVGCLYFVIGWSCVVGIVLILILSLLTSLVGKSIVVYQEHLLKCTDERVGLVNEVLQGIRMVKYFAYESLFETKINRARTKELEATFKLWYPLFFHLLSL